MTKAPKSQDSSKYSTGNKVVDAIGGINVQGIIFDSHWMRHVRFVRAGRVYITAVLVFADIVDRYRPIFERDENDNVTARLKFKTPYWVETKKRWAKRLGISEKQLEEALKFLVARKLIQARPLSAKRKNAWVAAGYLSLDSLNEKPLLVAPVPEEVCKVSGLGEVEFLEVGEHLDTKNPIANKIGQLRFEGHVVGYNWLGHPLLCSESGKFNIVACLVFAELFFYHTPTIKTDPESRRPIGYTAKFHGERMYINYARWSRDGWASVEQLRDAVSFLHKKTLIDRTVGTVMLLNDHESNNMPLVKLIVETVQQLTFGAKPSRQAQPLKASVPTGEPPKVGDILPDTPEESGGHFAGDPPAKTQVPDISPEKCAPFSSMHPYSLSGASNLVSNPIITDDPQSTNNLERPAPAVVASQNSRLPFEQQQLVDNICALRTGLPKGVIAELVAANPQHCAVWLEHWPSQPEADPVFWLNLPKNGNGRKPTMGGALRLRLKDPNVLPPEVMEAEARAAARERRAANTQQNAQTAKQRAEQEAARVAAQNQEVRERREAALTRFEGLSLAARQEVLDAPKMVGAIGFIRDKLNRLKDFEVPENETLRTETIVGFALEESLPEAQQFMFVEGLVAAFDQLDEAARLAREAAQEAGELPDEQGSFVEYNATMGWEQSYPDQEPCDHCATLAEAERERAMAADDEPDEPGTEDEFDEDEEEEWGEDAPPAPRYDLYIAGLLPYLESGLSADQLDTARESIAPFFDDPDWEELKRLTIESYSSTNSVEVECG